MNLSTDVLHTPGFKEMQRPTKTQFQYSGCEDSKCRFIQRCSTSQNSLSGRYEDESALAVDHRSSEPYKRMRKAVGEQEILSQPTDLRLLQPAGIGFLARDGKQSVLQNNYSVAQDIILIKEYSPPSSEAKQKLLDSLRSAADHEDIKAKRKGILSFWVLEYKPDYEDHGVKVVVRITDKAAQALFELSQAMISVK